MLNILIAHTSWEENHCYNKENHCGEREKREGGEEEGKGSGREGESERGREGGREGVGLGYKHTNHWMYVIVCIRPTDFNIMFKIFQSWQRVSGLEIIHCIYVYSNRCALCQVL